MKKTIAFIVLIAAQIFSLPVVLADNGNPVSDETRTVTVSGKSFNVRLVKVDLSNPLLEVVPVTAEEGIGHDESFSSIIDRTGAVAAINGTFFNAYEKNDAIRYPNGLMHHLGQPIHSGDNTSLLVSSEKKAEIARISLGVKMTVTHNKSSYPIFPWGVNKYYGEDEIDQVVLYTPAMGKEIPYPNGTKAVIADGKIVNITTDPVTFPEEGCVLFAGHSSNNKTYLIPNLHIGDSVQIQSVAKDLNSGQMLDPQNWLAAIGAGPKLVTKGEVDVDFARDGFDDPKITVQANRRSFIGIDGDGRLAMGTMDYATVQEEAEAALAVGLTEAMNLDGGSSSALFANGQVLTAPGRKLSNAWVIRKLNEPAVQLSINGKFIPDFRGLIRNETTLVPFRPLLEAMQADFQWDGPTSTLNVKKGKVSLAIKPDQTAAQVNGTQQVLETPAQIMNGHIYVPLRFVVETFKGKVSWDSDKYRVSIELSK